METLKLKITLVFVFSLLIAGTSETFGQTPRVNGDLPGASPKPTPKPTPPGSPTTSPTPPRGRGGRSNNGGGNRRYRSPGNRPQSDNPTPPVNPPPPPPPTPTPTPTPKVVAPAAPPETPAQILDRYMNFQQTTSVNRKDWESVVAQTTAALQTNPNDPVAKAQSFIAQGHLAFSLGDFSNALIRFNAAAQTLPQSALPHYCIGQVYLVTRQPKEAQEALEEALKLKNDFALAYKAMGEVMTLMRKTKKADEYYKKAAQLALTGGATSGAGNGGGDSGIASNSQFINSSGSAMPESGYEVELKNARSLTARKKWQESLDKLMSLEENNKTAELYIAIGDNFMGLEQALSAQQAYRKATEVNSDSALAFFKLGTVLAEMNEHQAAYEAFEKALVLDTQGKHINRATTRKMADRAKDKADDLKGDKGKKPLSFF